MRMSSRYWKVCKFRVFSEARLMSLSRRAGRQLWTHQDKKLDCLEPAETARSTYHGRCRPCGTYSVLFLLRDVPLTRASMELARLALADTPSRTVWKAAIRVHLRCRAARRSLHLLPPESHVSNGYRRVPRNFSIRVLPPPARSHVASEYSHQPRHPDRLCPFDSLDILVRICLKRDIRIGAADAKPAVSSRIPRHAVLCQLCAVDSIPEQRWADPSHLSRLLELTPLPAVLVKA